MLQASSAGVAGEPEQPPVPWALFTACLLSFAALHVAATHLVAYLCSSHGTSVKPRRLHSVSSALVNMVFAAIEVPLAFHAIFLGAPDDFAKPEAAYRDFPHTQFCMWLACSYFLYHFMLAVMQVTCDPWESLRQASDVLDMVHASFSLGGGLLSALAPRMQNMYMWLMAFSEVTNLLLQPRYVLLNCGLADIYPRTFHRITVAFFIVFTLFRVLVMVPRYVVHVWQIVNEFKGEFPDAGLDKNHSTLEPFFDLVMTSLSTGFNLYWFKIMAVKAVRMCKGKAVDTKQE